MKKRVNPGDSSGLAHPKPGHVKESRRKKRLSFQRIEDLPKDGIEKYWDPERKHVVELCVTAEAMGERRYSVWVRSGARCEGCLFPIGESNFEMHHISGKGAGKRCECLNCLQALCKDATMQDGTLRPGCHSKVHADGRLGSWYERG